MNNLGPHRNKGVNYIPDRSLNVKNSLGSKLNKEIQKKATAKVI